MLKTSGGKMIAPQPIENKLKANVLVAQAALVGDKHKFACVLISPNFAALEGWAKGQGIAAGDHAALVKDAKVVKAYQEIVDKVNMGLPNYESMKRMSVVAEEWSVEDGTLTPSMKLKRRVVEKRYTKEIGEFYADEATATKVMRRLDGDGEGVEGCGVNFDSGVGVPVVEFVVVAVEDGGDGGAVAVLGFAHDDGADGGEEAMGAVEKVDLGAFDVDFYEAGWRGLGLGICSRSESRVMQWTS